MRPGLPRPSYADVASTLAVAVALSGTAYAAGLANNSVKGRHVAANAINTRHVADGSLRAADLGTGSIGGRAVKDGSIAAPDLATGSVDSRAVADAALGAGDLAPNAVGRSELKADTVDGSKIQDETIAGIDIREGAISSTRMTSGVKELLFGAAHLAVNQTYPDITVSNGSWPAGAPTGGAPITATWTQDANSIDVVSAYARVSYPEACSATSASPGRGFDVKVVDASQRVISANSPSSQDGTSYNGNGFWDQQTALPGVTYRAPFSVDLADDPQAFVDYVHLPIELSEFVAGGSDTARAVRVYLRRSSSACSPEITDARVLVMRYPL